ncbi:MAG: 50S ribosomal protein L24 [Spirochaetaceae bacterium]|nr:50S ribosomal protein L24 [Spirochaetaceae bacterium]
MAEVKYKLKKGDQVKLIAGKDKGKTGLVLKVDRENGKVLVEGLNIVKKTVKPKSQGEKGNIVEVEAAIHISNVMIICSKCGPSKVGIRKDGENKVRFCKKCEGVL